MFRIPRSIPFGEMAAVFLLLGVIIGLPVLIFAARHPAALQSADGADAVVVFAGRNDGEPGQAGAWAVEYANVPVWKNEDDIPVIRVGLGTTVLFRVTAQDITHGFALREYGLDVVVHPGTYEDVRFVADKAGEFTLECSVFCGLGHHGMVAKLMVEE